jgi:general secretion pathway protein B
MSLILDALRKIERERKAKRQSSHEIRNDVLHYHGAAPNAEQSRIIPLTVAIVLISLAGALVFFSRKSQQPHFESAQPKGVLQQESPPIDVPQPLPSAPTAQQRLETKPEETTTAPQPLKQADESINRQQSSSGKAITVSGIAWQDERSLRRAVVNGQLVGEGAELDGAKIIEIKENYVRFSRDGESFEVGHSSGAVRP